MNIIITGASRGIGYELAEIFASSPGNKVVAIARTRDGLDKLVKVCRHKNYPGEIMALPFDLTSGTIEEDLLPAVTQFISETDVLINNAGYLVRKSFDLLNEEDFDLTFNANVKSAFMLIRALLPYFSEDSHIVNIGSMGGFQGSAKFKGLSLYSASKGALAILTECLAEEFKERKIRVNCLALGSAQTEMLFKAFPGYAAPLSAGEMARFIADFAMTGHKWFNGKVLPVSLSTP